MRIIPLNPVASQTLAVALALQPAQINVYQKRFGMFLDLYVNNELIIGGVICQNINRIVRNTYLGFVGDLIFYDNEGNTDPYYTGLGSRYSLIYLELVDLLGQG